MIEEPTLNTNKSGRSPWGQMCCFTPVILVPRQEDKRYKISLRDPVVIYFFMKEEGREEKKKRKNLLGRVVGQGRAWLLLWSALEMCGSETATPPVDYSRLNRNWAQLASTRPLGRYRISGSVTLCSLCTWPLASVTPVIQIIRLSQ